MESRTVNGLSMNSPDVYKTPQANLSENQKPLIGGWLRFFQVINVLGLLFSVFVVLSFPVMHLYVEGVIDSSADLFAILFELAPGLVTTFLIVRALPKNDAGVPDRIKALITYYVGFTVLFYGILTALLKAGYITEKPTFIVGDIIYYLIWVSYFQKSKRVRVYYGANAQ